MARDDLSERLRATFVQELEDQLRMMDASLLTLESQPADREAIRTLFRAAHSVKGAARVAGVPLVEEACHALETLFAQVRDRRRALAGGDFSLLFAMTDALAEAAKRLRAGEAVREEGLRELMARVAGAGVVAETEPEPEPGTGSGTAPEPEPEPETGPEPEPETGPEPEPGGASPAAAAAADTVRVSGERLDVLAGFATDLLTTSGAVAGRPRALEGLSEELARWAAAWRAQGRENGRGPDDARGRDARAELDRQLHQLTASLAQLTRAAQDDARILQRATDDVLGGVRGLRMRRFGDAVEGLPRAVRDVAAATGKHVELVVEGEDVEADRVVIDTLREPLLHLVRNAVDHGIETPEARRAAGKPERGTVRVAAALEQGRLRVLVEDDGGGLDTGALRGRIAALGEDAPRDGRALARRLLAGGITTRAEATSISGRGVGLDLVRAAVERIGGSLDVRWEQGAFTRFVIDSPPSPATLRALIVEASDQLFALPIGQVERVVRVRAEQVREVEGRPALVLGDAPLPLATLAGLLGAPLRERAELAGAPALVLRAAGDALALIVDAVAEEREVVVRPLDRRAYVAHLSGGALLPSGRVALVLIARTLVDAGLSREIQLPHIARADEAPVTRHVFVVDDSITTRTLEQSVLEAAGYRVTVAVDGQDAWEKLLLERPDLVVSDVEMPRMTGFDLCRRMRASKRFADVPVVLVTGMESDEDRALGLEVGADAYILKSSFDQTALLDTIRQLAG